MPNVNEIVGHNGYQYHIKKDWVAASDQKLPLKDCHEMVMGANGLLYMLGNETTNNVIVFNKDGKVMGSWGHDYPGGHGLTLHNENGEEFLYITDTIRSIVAKTTLDGKVIMELGYPKEISGYGDATAYKPTETLIIPNGDIYVTDGYGLQFVIHYNAKGEYIRHFGGRGDGPSNLHCAHGIALDNRNADKNVLLVTSRNQNAFKQFSLTGEYLGTIDMPGSFICRPVVNGKNIYAAVFRSGDNQNFGSGYLTVLDEQNQVISSPGATEPIYQNGTLLPQRKLTGHFIHPHDVCVDDDENLYVPQWNSNQVYPVKLIRV